MTFDADHDTPPTAEVTVDEMAAYRAAIAARNAHEHLIRADQTASCECRSASYRLTKAVEELRLALDHANAAFEFAARAEAA